MVGSPQVVQRREELDADAPTMQRRVDFWLLTDSAFDRSRFSRRYREKVLGLGIYVPTPEDTILAKLQWAKASGGSERHIMDALRVYEVQAGTLDVEYLDLWARILREAEPEA